MKNKIICVLLLATLTCSFAACSNSSEKEGTTSQPISQTASGETIKLKLSHNAAEGQPISLACLKLADDVYEQTDGRVQIELYPNNTLGSEAVTRDMLTEGTLEMLAIGTASINTYTIATDLITNFYTFDSEEQMMAVLEGDFGQKYYNETLNDDLGVRVLDFWAQSPRLMMSNKPIYSVDDFKNLKVRTPSGIPAWQNSMTAMGAMTVTIGLDEAFSSMQQGVVDAVEIPLDFLYFYSFQEISDYLIMTEHNYYAQMIVINENSYKKLTKEEREILDKCVKEAGDYADTLRKENNTKIMDELIASGMTVIDIDDEMTEELKAKIEPLYKEFAKTYGEKGEEIYNAWLDAKNEFDEKNK